MFPPGQPAPLPSPMGPTQPMGMPPQQMPPQQATSQMGFGQPMMPQSDPNALLAALLGGNDALGNNLMALFQARQQNPNAMGGAFFPFEPPQPYQPQQPPQSPVGAPMSMAPGLPF